MMIVGSPIFVVWCCHNFLNVFPTFSPLFWPILVCNVWVGLSMTYPISKSCEPALLLVTESLILYK